MTKRLIEFGWDEPDPAFLRRHAAQIDRTPFDGVVFHPPRNFTWECWGRKAFPEDALDDAVADLRATRNARPTRHFLRFNTAPADLDWFDPHDAVLGNARLAARAARRGRCAGILFDIEQYAHPLFDFSKRADGRPWDAVAAQVRRRGSEVMDAFQDGFPNLTVFLTYGYCLPWQQSQQGRKPLAQTEYGLLAPFCDGLFAAARGRTRIVDGGEIGYWFATPDRFADARTTIRDGLLPIVADPAAYRKRLSVAFGIWMDFDWRAQGWDTDAPEKNPRPPALFRQLVEAALAAADEYVWIYTETPRWWSEAGAPVKLPAAYDAALRNLPR